MDRMAPQSLRRIFALPAVIALLSSAGLILGLTGQGWRDTLSWLLVGLPIPIFAALWSRRH